MKLTIERSSTLSGAGGTFGNLLIDGRQFCRTCEQPWDDNKPNQSCLPLGQYQLLPYDSPRHGRTVVFHNPALGVYGTPEMESPTGTGRSLCEIHVANWPSELQGCVAVGETVTDIPPGGRGVTSSAATFQSLCAQWGDRSNLIAEIVMDNVGA